MSVAAVNDRASTASAVGNPSAAGRTAPAMGKEDFLKLLVAQLSHQDPLKPTDGTQFVAELAQFSNLEQAISANKQLGDIADKQGRALEQQAYGLIGKRVSADTSTVSVDAFNASSIHFQTSAATAHTSVQIIDGAGNVVRTLQAGAAGPGPQVIPWDGADDTGTRLPAGTYSVRAVATGSDGSAITPRFETDGIVGAVSFRNGQTMLDIGGAQVSLSEVRQVQ